jgi:hypothetical protein
VSGDGAINEPHAAGPITTMWEVRAVEGRVEDLLSWLAGRAPTGSQVYRSAAGQERVVVLDPTGTAARVLADPPAELVARPPHAWDFLRV